MRQRKVMAVVALILSLFIASCSAGDSSITPHRVDDAQEGGLFDLKGNTLHFSDFRGKWILVNYWASYCPPCVREVPELNAFYKNHLNNDAVVLGVNYDAFNKATLKKVVARLNIHYPILLTDPAARLGIAEVTGLPTSYLVSPTGDVVARLLGAQTQADFERVIHRWQELHG